MEGGAAGRLRKVGNKGEIQYLAQRHFVSEGLRNEFVALKPTDTDGVLDVYFCDYRIRQIDVRISA